RLPKSVAQTSPQPIGYLALPRWYEVLPDTAPLHAADRSLRQEASMTPKATTAAPPNSQGQLDESDLKAAELITKVYERMTRHLGRVIVGQGEVVKQVLLALFCQGHCILEGVPGLAKTLMISTIAQMLSLNFKRIQFTPD